MIWGTAMTSETSNCPGQEETSLHPGRSFIGRALSMFIPLKQRQQQQQQQQRQQQQPPQQQHQHQHGLV